MATVCVLSDFVGGITSRIKSSVETMGKAFACTEQFASVYNIVGDFLHYCTHRCDLSAKEFNRNAALLGIKKPSPNKSLLISGQYGSGKTTLIRSATQEIERKTQATIIFKDANSIIDDYIAAPNWEKHEPLKDLARLNHLLVIDDVARRKTVDDPVASIINRRYNLIQALGLNFSQMPIITTNLNSSQAISDYYGDGRLAGIIEECYNWVDMPPVCFRK